MDRYIVCCGGSMPGVVFRDGPDGAYAVDAREDPAQEVSVTSVDLVIWPTVIVAQTRILSAERLFALSCVIAGLPQGIYEVKDFAQSICADERRGIAVVSSLVVRARSASIEDLSQWFEERMALENEFASRGV